MGDRLDFVCMMVSVAITGLLIIILLPTRAEQWGYVPLITEAEPYYYFPFLSIPSLPFFLFWLRDKRVALKQNE